MQRPDNPDARLGRFLVNRLEQAPSRVTVPTVSLLQGMPYVHSDHSDIRVTFAAWRAMYADWRAEQAHAVNQ